MKRIILVATLVLGFAAVASAQPKAVGLRGGFGIEATYQHTLGDKMIQADLGLVGGGFNIAGTYNWTLLQPKWTNKGEWSVYAGPGAALGFGITRAFHIAAAGMVGLEYQFWFPLQLSVDIRPQLGLAAGPGAGFHVTGYWPALSARYMF